MEENRTLLAMYEDWSKAGESIRIRRLAHERTNLQNRFKDMQVAPHRNLTCTYLSDEYVACRGCTVEYVLYIQYMYSCVLYPYGEHISIRFYLSQEGDQPPYIQSRA